MVRSARVTWVVALAVAVAAGAAALSPPMQRLGQSVLDAERWTDRAMSAIDCAGGVEAVLDRQCAPSSSSSSSSSSPGAGQNDKKTTTTTAAAAAAADEKPKAPVVIHPTVLVVHGQPELSQQGARDLVARELVKHPALEAAVRAHHAAETRPLEDIQGTKLTAEAEAAGAGAAGKAVPAAEMPGIEYPDGEPAPLSSSSASDKAKKAGGAADDAAAPTREPPSNPHPKPTPNMDEGERSSSSSDDVDGEKRKGNEENDELPSDMPTQDVPDTSKPKPKPKPKPEPAGDEDKQQEKEDNKKKEEEKEDNKKKEPKLSKCLSAQDREAAKPFLPMVKQFAAEAEALLQLIMLCKANERSCIPSELRAKVPANVLPLVPAALKHILEYPPCPASA